MYQISNYKIKLSLNKEEVLLYSTISTSLIILERNIYEEIFERKEFEKYENICEKLLNMGFLFTGENNVQAYELEQVRKKLMESDHGITAITIAPTMMCNARCYYCFENGAVGDKMTIHTAKQVVKFLVQNCKGKRLYISWFGGEPLMAVDIIDYITGELIREGIIIESNIVTNGVLIDKAIVKKLIKWNTTKIQITLDGIGEQYNKTKNYRGSLENPFEKVMEGIALLIENNINVHLRVNYVSDNYDIVYNTMKYLHETFGQNKNLYIYGAPIELPEKKQGTIIL